MTIKLNKERMLRYYQLHGDVYECDALVAVDFDHYSIRLYLVVDHQQLHSNLLFESEKIAFHYCIFSSYCIQ